MYEAASLGRPLEAGLALLLSLLRPLHGWLVQRAVLRRSGRAALQPIHGALGLLLVPRIRASGPFEWRSIWRHILDPFCILGVARAIPEKPRKEPETNTPFFLSPP